MDIHLPLLPVNILYESLEVSSLKGLFKNVPIQRQQLQLWEKHALDTFEAKMTDNSRPFPCIPATLGFSLNHLRYGFIGDPRLDTSFIQLADLLSEYTFLSRQFGKYTSLIIFFDTPKDLVENYHVETYEQLFWKQLNGLSAMDQIDWPEHIPTDPHLPVWEFCYNGEPFFMYCATPAHQKRQSRHFNYFMLAITPRWVLNEFNKNEAFAKKIRNQIRHRLANYDSIPVHHDLNTYGNANNFEWKQYFLHDDESSLLMCPFHKNLKIDD